jgi:DNA-binding Lrp family transcriptional regulator
MFRWGVLLIKAFILLIVDSGYEDAIAKTLRDVPGIQNVFVSYGTYDLIVELSADNMDLLKNSVSNKIRSVDHVRSTLTLIEQ